MSAIENPFDDSIRLQIKINQERTPTQRFQALCDLLDAARAMAPLDAAACERRMRSRIAREHEREQWREQCAKWAAAQRRNAEAGI